MKFQKNVGKIVKKIYPMPTWGNIQYLAMITRKTGSQILFEMILLTNIINLVLIRTTEIKSSLNLN